MEAILVALLKILVKQYPGLPWAAVLAQLEQAGEGFVDIFRNWWDLKMDEPWPGMPEMPLPHPQGPPTDDPFQP